MKNELLDFLDSEKRFFENLNIKFELKPEVLPLSTWEPSFNIRFVSLINLISIFYMSRALLSTALAGNFGVELQILGIYSEFRSRLAQSTPLPIPDPIYAKARGYNLHTFNVFC